MCGQLAVKNHLSSQGTIAATFSAFFIMAETSKTASVDPTPVAEVPTQPAQTPKPPAGPVKSAPAEVPVTAENTEPPAKPKGLSKAVLKAGAKVTYIHPGTTLPGQGGHFDLEEDYEVPVASVSTTNFNGHIGITPESAVEFAEYEGQIPESEDGKPAVIYAYTAEYPNLVELS